MSGSGETGIRTGFKFRHPKGFEGSIPSSRTNPFDKPIATIYGPYVRAYPRSKRRRQLVVMFMDGSRTTITYARWLMIQHLGRRLEGGEHVDHINDDPLDDRVENLQILSQAENARKASFGRQSPLKGTHKGWTHGSMYAWQKKKCDCSECAQAKRAWYDKRNASRRKRSRCP